ncbi:uncharacterized protein LOC124491436 isoform X1 [Dermatophagoides farinae]
MTKKNQIHWLRRHLLHLFASIDAGYDLHFIRDYKEYVDKLVKFVEMYGTSYATEHDKFKAVQKKVEALINSPEIPSLIKESLRSKFDRANELAADFSESKSRRKLDENNYIVKSLHAIQRGEISSAYCCSNEFRDYMPLYRHIVADHANLYVDDSIPQNESSDLSQIQGTSRNYPMVDQSTRSRDIQMLNEIEPPISLEHSYASLDEQSIPLDEQSISSDEQSIHSDDDDDESENYDDVDMIYLDEEEPFEEESFEEEQFEGDPIEFLIEVKNSLSDSEYSTFEFWVKKMIEGRLFFNFSRALIRNTFPGLIRSIPSASNNLKDYIDRMSNSSYLQDKFAMMNPNCIQPEEYESTE